MSRGIVLIILFLMLYFLRGHLQDTLLQFSVKFVRHISKIKSSTHTSQSTEIEEQFTNQGILIHQIKELQRENERLKNILGLKQGLNKTVTAKVLARIRGEVSDELIIDVGELDGVTKNSALVNTFGLLGIVEDVGKEFSKVITYCDPRFQISARVASTREIGLLIGRGRGKNLKLLYLDLNTNSKTGDLVLTSGEGFISKGLIVGEIEEILTHPSQLYKIAEVKPYPDLNKLEEILVLIKEK